MTVTEKDVIQSVTEAGDEWQYHDDDDKQFLIRFAAIICAKQREKDTKDDERYKWLRDAGCSIGGISPIYRNKWLDEAIDEEMNKRGDR